LKIGRYFSKDVRVIVGITGDGGLVLVGTGVKKVDM
jgi:hypothetical protein